MRLSISFTHASEPELDEDPIRPVYFPIAAPDEILD